MPASIPAPCCSKRETEIAPEENAIELGSRLAVMGADLLVETLAGLEAGAIIPEKQDNAQATCAPLLKKEDGLIDWTQPAQAIHNRVRGLQPWPGAHTTFRGQPLHIWKARVGDAASSAAPGSVLGARPLVVACGEGTLELSGSPDGRPQADSRRRFRQRTALDGE